MRNGKCSNPFLQTNHGSLILCVHGCVDCLDSATVVAVAVGTLTPACKTSDQCARGYYCALGVSDRCQYCGSHAPVIIQYDQDGQTYNNVFDYRYAGWNKTYVAEICTDPMYVPTCDNVCKDRSATYIIDAIPPSRAGTLPYNNEWAPQYGWRTCGERCDDLDAQFGVGGTEGFNFPP
eukprot:COSAG02_NODE_76_length_41115_cov_60.967817_6_plen_178_part_00